MINKVTSISQEDLDLINKARLKTLNAAYQAEKVVSEARIADLEQQVTVRNVYIKYGLTVDCKIDENTGFISRPEEESVNETE
jgi:hypothetical protein